MCGGGQGTGRCMYSMFYRQEDVWTVCFIDKQWAGEIYTEDVLRMEDCIAPNRKF